MDKEARSPMGIGDRTHIGIKYRVSQRNKRQKHSVEVETGTYIGNKVTQGLLME